jgi:hypothetical protein
VLALKLVLVPLFLLGVSLAGRRWGPSVAGWLAGLPLVVAPILLILAIEQGAPFAARAAVSTLAATAATVAYAVAYARACRRLPWGPSLLLGLLAWAAAVAALSRLPASVPVALGLSLAALLAASWGVPPAPPATPRQPGGRGELALRMAAGALLTVAVTAVAAGLGAGWSGLLTAFPVLTVVLTASSHRAQGAGFTLWLLRSLIAGMYSFVAFCATLALALGATGAIPASFAIAIAATAAVQWVTRRRPEPAAQQVP